MNTETLQLHLQKNAQISDIVGTNWVVKEIGDGNLNYVYLISGTKGNIVVKQVSRNIWTRNQFKCQAIPYIRCVGETWPLTEERAFFEQRALFEERKYCPEHVPRVYYWNKELCITVLEYLQNHIVLRKVWIDYLYILFIFQGLILGKTYSHLSDNLSDFLAKTLFYSSGLFLKSEEKRKAIAFWSANDLCALTENVHVQYKIFIFTVHRLFLLPHTYLTHWTNIQLALMIL